MQQIVEEEVKNNGREVRRAASHAGFGALIYSGVMGIISMVTLIPLAVGYIFENLNTQDMEGLLNDLLDYLINHPYTGIISLASAVLGLAGVFLCFLKQGTHKELFRKNNPMTLKKFGALFCIMYLFNFIGDACYRLIEQDLNVFGLSTAFGLELATGNQTTVSMFLYAGIIGPVAEELIFRGFLLRRMEKHGKLLAILVTSLLFGLMHQNLPQVLCATMIGFVLGYVAMEYSIIWSIVLHIFNNLILCDFLSRLIEGTGEKVQYLIYRGFDLVTGIIALVIIIRKRKEIVSWVRTNLCHKPVLVRTFTSVGVLVSIIYFVIGTISCIGIA